MISPQYKASLERSEAKIADLQGCITKQKKELAAACDKMLKDHKKGKNVEDELAYWQKRAPQIKGYCDAIIAEMDVQIELQKKELDRIKKEGLRQRQLMRGLTSYAVATGDASPDLLLLHATLGDLLDAKNDHDREEADKTVSLIMKYGKFGNEAKPVSTVLDEFERLEGEAASEFYRQNETAIKAALQVRFDEANKETK
jgi:hypothetical protein